MGEDASIDERRFERSLLRGMARGDRAAFDRFVAHYTPALMRYAQTHLAGHPEAVPDIVQATLVAAVEKLPSFRGDGPLGAWLVGICRFQIGTYWRRWQVRERWTAEGSVDLERVESAEAPADQRLAAEQRQGQVHSTLELLPPPYGEVLEWKYLEELSVRDIAGRLGITPKAAESTLTRARKAFRRLFDAVSEPRTNP